MKNLLSKPTAWLVLALLAFLMWSISREANAEAWLDLAPASVWIGGNHQDGQSAILFHQRFQDKYEIGVVLLVDVNDRGASNRAIEVLRVTRWKNWEAGIGYALWGNQSEAWTANDTFALTIGYRWGKWAIRERHWSTGGSSSHNSGLDFLTISRSFGD